MKLMQGHPGPVSTFSSISIHKNSWSTIYTKNGFGCLQIVLKKLAAVTVFKQGFLSDAYVNFASFSFKIYDIQIKR